MFDSVQKFHFTLLSRYSATSDPNRTATWPICRLQGTKWRNPYNALVQILHENSPYLENMNSISGAVIAQAPWHFVVAALVTPYEVRRRVIRIAPSGM
jgi:hypothetical protein